MTTTIGVDLGYGFVKATDGDKRIRFPALVGSGNELIMSDLLGKTFDYDVEIETDAGKRHYFVGELAIKESKDAVYNMQTEKSQDADTEALWLTTLALLAKDEEPLTVVTGLPLAQYESQRKQLKETLSRMRGIVTVEGRTISVQADKVHVIPQAFGAMMGALLNPITMAPRNPEWFGEDGLLALVDVGTCTTGFVGFETVPEFRMLNNLSNSVNIGIRDFHVALSNVFRARTGETPKLEDVRLYDRLARDGKVFYDGRDISMEPERSRHIERLGESIVKNLLSQFGSDMSKRIRTAFVAGGGSYLVEKALKERFERVIEVPDPQMANAIGFYLFGKTRG